LRDAQEGLSACVELLCARLPLGFEVA